MRNPYRQTIPEHILLPLVRHYRLQNPKDPSQWTDKETTEVRALAGPEWRHTPLDDLRCQSEGLRKQGKLPSLSGHGKTKLDPEPDWYTSFRRHLESSLEFQHWTKQHLHGCQICTNTYKLGIFHSLYEKVREEPFANALLLCLQCQRVARGRRQRMLNGQ